MEIRNNSLGAKVINLCVWVIWLAAYPSVLSLATGIPFIIPILLAIGIMFFIQIHRKYIKYNSNILFLFILLMFFWIIQLVFRVDFSYVSNIFQVFVVLVVYLSGYNFLELKKIVEQYVLFIIVLSILGCISFSLAMFFYGEPLFSFVAHDGRYNHLFFFTFSNTTFPFLNGSMIRFSGIFDEPGALTFYATYALFFNKLLLKNKKYEKLLLIAPILTTSLAYIIIVLLYLVLFKVKSIKSSIALFIFIPVFIILLSVTKGTEYYRIYELTIGRVEMDDSSGDLKGNNRADLIEKARSYFKENILFGKGKAFFEKNDIYIGANYLFVGALYGLLGYLILFSLLWYAIFLCLYKGIFFDGLKCCLLLIVTFLQRPDVTNIFQLSSLLLFVLCISFSVRNNACVKSVKL